MKKRILSILTALALCLSLCPTQAFAAEYVASVEIDGVTTSYGTFLNAWEAASAVPGKEAAITLLADVDADDVELYVGNIEDETIGFDAIFKVTLVIRVRRSQRVGFPSSTVSQQFSYPLMSNLSFGLLLMTAPAADHTRRHRWSTRRFRGTVSIHRYTLSSMLICSPPSNPKRASMVTPSCSARTGSNSTSGAPPFSHLPTAW